MISRLALLPIFFAATCHQLAFGETPPPALPNFTKLWTLDANRIEIAKDMMRFHEKIVNHKTFNRIAYLTEFINKTREIGKCSVLDLDPATFMGSYQGTDSLGLAQYLFEQGRIALIPGRVAGKEDYCRAANVAKTPHGLVFADLTLNEFKPIFLTEKDRAYEGNDGLFEWDMELNLIRFTRKGDPKDSFIYEYPLLHLNNPIPVIIPQIFRRWEFITAAYKNNGELGAYVSLNFDDRALHIKESANSVRKTIPITKVYSLPHLRKKIISKNLSETHLKRDHEEFTSEIWDIIENWDWLLERLGLGQNILPK